MLAIRLVDTNPSGSLLRQGTRKDTGAAASGSTEVKVYYGTRGDADGDGDIDLADWAAFPDCMTGPTGGPPAPECAVFDFTPDSDVDLADLAAFQVAI